MTSIEKGFRFVRELLRVPLLAAWGLYIFMLPFRLVPSGYPQPVDGLALLLFVVTLAGSRQLAPRLRTVMVALTSFTVWVCVVDIAWCVIENEWGVNVLNPMYYIFNALLFMTVLMLAQRFGERFVRVTVYSIVAVTLFQVAASFLIHFSKTRTSLFFNNSNQLGYYSLLTACLVSVTQRRVGLGLGKASAALTACAYLALLSASRSALIGIGVLALLLLITNPRVIAFGVIVALGLVVVAESSVSDAIDNSQRRLTEDRDPTRNFFEDRGYDRIWNEKEYLLTGAGEGHAARFAEEGSANIAGLEIHSSVGTILFCYGIIGMFLIGRFVARVVRGARWRLSLMLLPILLQSLAHQGLRFSLLWVVLAVFVVIRTSEATKGRAGPAQARTPLMTSPSRR